MRVLSFSNGKLSPSVSSCFSRPSAFVSNCCSFSSLAFTFSACPLTETPLKKAFIVDDLRNAQILLTECAVQTVVIISCGHTTAEEHISDLPTTGVPENSGREELHTCGNITYPPCFAMCS